MLHIIHDGQQGSWHTAKVNLEPGYFGLMFEFRFANLLSQENAGLDDISISEGTCQPAGLFFVANH